MSKTHIAGRYESAMIGKAVESKIIPEFRAGDTLAVKIRILDGASERVSLFQGICIARSNKGINSFCILRKMSGDVGVERVIPLYSPLISGIEVVKHGKVRRAKLFYLRFLRGKKARIKEKVNFAAKFVAKN